MPKSPHGYDTRSWNPVTGCSKLSAGCAHCWAEEYSRRMGWPWKVTLHAERLDEPLKWRKPQVVACSYMGDLFHEDVPTSFIRQVFRVMEYTPRHSYLLLTKRPQRALADYKSYLLYPPPEGVCWRFKGSDTMAQFLDGQKVSITIEYKWPPNVWVGVSVEDQATADERIPLLLETPAAHRWVSAEPLLGPVDLASWLPCGDPGCAEETEVLGWLDGIVVGGESGPRHRPCDPAWIADIVRQCDAASIPCFVKQASHRYPGRQGDIPDALWPRKAVPW